MESVDKIQLIRGCMKMIRQMEKDTARSMRKLEEEKEMLRRQKRKVLQILENHSCFSASGHAGVN